ncbi:hypothetical protein [Acetobacterium carbinolicum]|uniref:hypothetical protein n=1 Tax=Acetobacterium carbinolicum TaxID=52690 RepID=UPI003BF47464
MRIFKIITENINTIFFYLKVISVMLVILCVVSITSIVGSNFNKSNSISTHYLNWYEQLPADDPIKKADYTIFILLKTQTDLDLLAGIILNTSEEIFKYELGKADITNLGILEKYLEKEFNKAKPEYIILNTVNLQSLKIITLEQGQTIAIRLYRNAEEISFYSGTQEKLSPNKDLVSLEEIISLDCVKAYVENNEIARIEGNKIRTISKGRTKLMLINKTELLDIDVIVQ